MTIAPSSPFVFESDCSAAFIKLRQKQESILIWPYPEDGSAETPSFISKQHVIVLEPIKLMTTDLRCQLGISLIKGNYAGAWLDHIQDSANPLQIMAQLCRNLPPGSPIAWRCAPNAQSGTPHWLDFWLRFAKRLGCTVEAYSTVGALVRTPTQTTAWSLDIASEVLVKPIQELFLHVFGGELGYEHYQWKYGSNAGGVVALIEDKVIAHCGALMRQVFIRGVPHSVAQLVDVMVHPNYRGILRKQGVFFEITASAIEIFGPLAFGFPNTRHLILGQKHGFYKPVDPLIELQWHVKKSSLRGIDRLVEIDFSNKDHCKKINQLWLNMADDLKNNTVGIRDLNWIRYRYLQHPVYQHLFFAVTCRWTGRWKGIVIGREEKKSLLILDWIGRMKMLPAMATAAVHIAKKQNLTYCSTWVTENFASCFERSLPIRHNPEITVPTIIWCQDGRENSLKNWWISPGDSDFR
ncbi:MAG: GNAT family N-acetyltransferase [Candidatus Cloacimonetes bacterium]|nr:GNAT family N-acetyltransferase [Candidatus Cloacimonadota bacterium]